MAVRAVTTGVTPLPETETVDDGPNPVPVTVTGTAVAPWPRTFGATDATLGAMIFEIVDRLAPPHVAGRVGLCGAQRVRARPRARGRRRSTHPDVAAPLTVCAGVPDAVEPAYTSTSTVAASPAAVPAEPVTVSTASLTTAPSAGLVRVTAGGLVVGRACSPP